MKRRLAPSCAAVLLASTASARDPQRVDYTIDVNLDTGSHELTGHERIELTNGSSKPLDELWWHLYLNAFSNDQTTFFRGSTGGRGSEKHEHWGYTDLKSVRIAIGDEAPVELWPAQFDKEKSSADRTDVRIALPKALAPGAHATLLVDFHAQLPEVVERTGYGGSFHMVGQWFPKLAKLNADGSFAHFPFHHFSEFYADFGRYDVTMRVPESFAVVATGERVDERVDDGRRVIRHVQSDVHDFAFAAWDKFRFLERTVSGRRIVVAYPPGFDAVAARELETASVALDEFSTWYSPYPYKVLSVVHPPSGVEEAGGMEYPTLITTGGAWWTPPGFRDIELVTVHELGHQWFYGLFASNEFQSPFLDEGFNTFAESRWMSSHLGEGSVLSFGPLRVADELMEAVGSADAVPHRPVGARSDEFASGSDYGALVYGRTGTVLTTLRRVYGADKFDAAMHAYGERFTLEHPTPADIAGVFREKIGEEAAAFFERSIFAKGWVDFELVRFGCESKHDVDGYLGEGSERRTSEGEEQKPVVKVSTVRAERRGDLVLPTEVELTFGDGHRERFPWASDSFVFERVVEGATCLRQATIDPDRKVLVDARRANDTRAIESGKAPFFSGVARMMLTAFEALFAWVSA
jgi:hypothetical protein